MAIFLFLKTNMWKQHISSVKRKQEFKTEFNLHESKICKKDKVEFKVTTFFFKKQQIYLFIQ